MDAVRETAAAVLLLTALAAAGCVGAKRGPAGVPVPPAPATLPRVAPLRVGLPAPWRGTLLFTTSAPPAPPRIGSAVYAPDSLDPSGRRWLRLEQAATDSAGALAPDTLLMRGFEDATDEEIAFERGELDVAVFWPGELSARMRFDPRFRAPELGLRSIGVLACVGGAGDTLGAPRADMEVLNREAFGGDLLPWSELNPGAGEAPPARYTVDPAMPGAQHLERILARLPHTGATRTLKLVYVNMPVVSYTMVPPAVHTPPDVASMQPLFALRCPVLVRSEARDGVRAIGAGAFAELAPCGARR